MPLDRLQPLADVGVEPGVDEGDPPILDVAVDQDAMSAAVREDEVVRDALLVVEEILLDQVAAVAETQHEVRVPEVGVVPHEMPDHRPVADRHHRFGNVLRIVAKPHSQSSAEQYDFHRSLTPSRDESAAPPTLVSA